MGRLCHTMLQQASVRGILKGYSNGHNGNMMANSTSWSIKTKNNTPLHGIKGKDISFATWALSVLFC